MTELCGKRVLVIGLGRTGRSVARFAASRGAQLVLCEQRPDVETDGLPAGAELHAGGEDPGGLSSVDLVVPSPGVARDHPLLRRALALGIPIVSEIELASWHIRCDLVAITGTNGKSTVTTMLAEILRAGGTRVFAGGNLGVPLIEAAGNDYDVVVAEVSSFQLEWVASFRPRVGIYLNLSEDHCERYRDLNEYGEFKARLFENQRANDWAVLNRDDPRVWALAGRLKARVVSFSVCAREGEDAAVWVEDGALRFVVDDRAGSISIKGFRLPGRHNLSNAMAAAAGALAWGIAPETIGAALVKFRGLPHRLEFVCERRGVIFIDDSKSTNVDGAVAALAACAAPVIWVAGGIDKGGDYAPLRALCREKVRAAILMGPARERMLRALADTTKVKLVETLSEAVAAAANAARSGDTVLLSPACSSFDQFKDYAHRGQVFKELVTAL
jgi:UDP-N-acetylmuramoylalanine--D-glutamate ligase